ncbi:hypothetical protein ACFY8W_14625 [Streptomyces sp. NPDC012637]|uniref:hypothetical protein n=1 Tax=Streptomyces sp. NPDC012637 TaxID=3364842 RepID=UPI0036EA0FD2
MLIHRATAAALFVVLALTAFLVPSPAASAAAAQPGPGTLVVSYEPGETEADRAEQEFPTG